MSIKLAKKLNASIINCDSMQIYKELNIGTAKIKEEEKQGIKHYLINTKSVFDDYNVCAYQKDARKILNGLIKENKKIIDYLLRKWGVMKELDVTTMKNIEGGADPILITGIVTMVIAFVSGILNGIANPKKCN